MPVFAIIVLGEETKKNMLFVSFKFILKAGTWYLLGQVYIKTNPISTGLWLNKLNNKHK